MRQIATQYGAADSGDSRSHRECPVCAATSVRQLQEVRLVLQDGDPLPSNYWVVACRECGMVFADVYAPSSTYDQYYSEQSHYEIPELSSGSGLTIWEAARFATIAGHINAHASSRDARILDIGCATGGLLRTLLDRGFHNSCGLDPSPTCARFVRNSMGCSAWTGSIYEPPAEIGSFDIAVLSGVLEHLHRPFEALTRTRELLQPDGLLCIGVPDATRYDEFLIAPFQDFNTEHINHFSADSLSRLMMRSGFNPVAIEMPIFGSSGSTSEGAVLGTFRKSEVAGAWRGNDTDLESSIRAYIRSSQTLMDRLDAELRRVLPIAPSWIVWGTGQLAMKLLAGTALGAARILAFVDGNPVNQGHTIRGVPIVEPGRVADLDAPILITSTIHEAEIMDAIRQKWAPSHAVYGLRPVVAATTEG